MNNPSLFCFPFTQQCNLMSEWGVYWQATTSIFTVVVGLVGVFKIYHELKRLNEQRAKDLADKETSAKLKRTEFFLSQHRRLFDNAELYSVLCLIDNDDPQLAAADMADKKRKFLTFFEEIALLVDSDQIRSEVAYYMFGYYARCARAGVNFGVDIDLSPAHWGMFYRFTDAATEFANQNSSGPPRISL
jgi:hypothetical protein